jgi:high-affinity nickel-transport protein
MVLTHRWLGQEIMSSSVLCPAALAVALGLRHGLDADHLAAIDGLTRFNMVGRRGFAPYCGTLFSAGHSAAIFFAAAMLAVLASAWTPPHWLEPAGKIFSAAILLLLGVSNLRPGAADTRAAQHGHFTGLRAGLFAAVLRSSRPWQVILVGVLFAVSFDAFGLAALFAASAAALGGVAVAAVLALAFALGMVAVDTGNGVWIARLASRSDRASKAASRAMTLTVAVISLLVGTVVACSSFWMSFDQWLNSHELTVSSLVVLAVLCAYMFGRSTPLV